MLDLGQRRLELGASEQREERRLVTDQAAKHVRPCCGGSQNDRRAVGVADDVRGGKTELLDERDQVVGVLEYAPLAGRALAGAVAAAIVREDLEALDERAYHGVPVVMVAPGPVDQNQRLSGPAQLVVQLDAVGASRRHDTPFRFELGRGSLSRGRFPAAQR